MTEDQLGKVLEDQIEILKQRNRSLCRASDLLFAATLILVPVMLLSLVLV